MKTETYIQLLPEHVIDQIKAGEVVERPASILKELLENSIDAGSTEIEIRIINNGLDLILVKDNGKGMSFEDLPLAFCRHATSKLKSFDDLYRLYTFGFRGEALASIASVSKVTCRTFNSEASSGGLIEFEGGEQTSYIKEEHAPKPGTQISVKNLFFNTPVRLKFVKSQSAEKRKMQAIIYSYLLSYPHISFRVQWDEEETEAFSASSDPAKRIKKVLYHKKKSSQDLIVIQGSYNNKHFQCYLSPDSFKGRSALQQYMFINKRPFFDKQLQSIIQNAANAIWPAFEAGHFCAFLECSPDEIDVNVHPQKTQIKFYKHGEVVSLISSSIKNALKPRKQEENKTKETFIQSSLSFEQNDRVSGPQFHDLGARTKEKSYSFLSEPIERQLESEKQGKDFFYSFTGFSLCYKSFEQGTRFIAVNNKLLFQYYLQKVLFSLTSESTPLIISEPIEGVSASPQQLATLAEVGFEIDQLAPEVVVVRSVPTGLQSFPYTSWLKYWLEKEKTLKGKTIQEKFENQLREDAIDIQLEKIHIKMMLNEFNLSFLLEHQIVKQLEEKHIRSFFNAKS